MADDNTFEMSPDDVVDATGHLDVLAGRIERLMATEAPNLAVGAPGRDEVSTRVASTLNAVHDTFAASAARGVTDIRELSATLRAHTDNVVAAEQEFVV